MSKEGGRTGLTLEEMIKESGLEEKDFRAVYLDWIDGACGTFFYTSLSFVLMCAFS